MPSQRRSSRSHKRTITGDQTTVADCGCVVFGSMQFCKTHAAAIDMLKALRLAKEALEGLAAEAGDAPEWNAGGYAYEACRFVNLAIGQAGGKP